MRPDLSGHFLALAPHCRRRSAKEPTNGHRSVRQIGGGWFGDRLPPVLHITLSKYCESTGHDGCNLVLIPRLGRCLDVFDGDVQTAIGSAA